MTHSTSFTNISITTDTECLSEQSSIKDNISPKAKKTNLSLVTFLKPSSFRGQKGLTLVEIIVVLVILSILIGVLTSGLFSQGDKAKAKINGLKMSQIQGYLNEYRLQYNSFPSSLEGLSGCTEQTGQNCIPIAKPEDLRDSWGTPLVYNTGNNGASYTLKSLGADKREGGSGADADLTFQGP